MSGAEKQFRDKHPSATVDKEISVLLGIATWWVYVGSELYAIGGSRREAFTNALKSDAKKTKL